MNSAVLKSFLEAPLPAKAPARNQRFHVEAPFEVKPLPIQYKAQSLTDDLALARTVCKDELRVAMCGIYYDMLALCRVTTNGNYLFVLPDKSLDKPQSLVLRPDGTKIYEPFPNYRDVVVSHDNQMTIDNPIAILSDLAGVLRAMRFIDGFIQTRIVYDGYSIMINPEFMFLALQTLVDTGAKKVILELPDFGEKKAMMFRDAGRPERYAMVMPIMESGDALTCTILDGKTYPDDPEEAVSFLNKKFHRAMAEFTWGMEYHYQELRKAFTEKMQMGHRISPQKIKRGMLEAGS